MLITYIMQFSFILGRVKSGTFITYNVLRI